MGIKNKQKTAGKFAAYASGGATRRWAIEVQDFGRDNT